MKQELRTKQARSLPPGVSQARDAAKVEVASRLYTKHA